VSPAAVFKRHDCLLHSPYALSARAARAVRPAEEAACSAQAVQCTLSHAQYLCAACMCSTATGSLHGDWFNGCFGVLAGGHVSLQCQPCLRTLQNQHGCICVLCSGQAFWSSRCRKILPHYRSEGRDEWVVVPPSGSCGLRPQLPPHGQHNCVLMDASGSSLTSARACSSEVLRAWWLAAGDQRYPCSTAGPGPGRMMRSQLVIWYHA
jgi:hypothetical protein